MVSNPDVPLLDLPKAPFKDRAFYWVDPFDSLERGFTAYNRSRLCDRVIYNDMGRCLNDRTPCRTFDNPSPSLYNAVNYTGRSQMMTDPTNDVSHEKALEEANAINLKCHQELAKRDQHIITLERRLSFLYERIWLEKDRGLGYASMNFNFLCPGPLPTAEQAVDSAIAALAKSS